MIFLKNSDLKELRERKSKELNYNCPICKNKRSSSEFVVDHKHGIKGKALGEDCNGMVRGVICKYCNSAEGRMLSVFKRSGLYGEIEFSDFLRSLADYLDKPCTDMVHPTEVPKEKIMKREFNKLCKEYSRKYPNKKPLEFPKSGKMTKRLRELSEEFGIKLIKE